MIMMRRNSGLFFLSLILFFSLIFFSCASNGGGKKGGRGASVSKLPVLPQKTTYFQVIPEEVIEDTVYGSPAAIKRAFSQIRKPDDKEYTEEERVLLAVMNAMMNYVWQSEKNTLYSPVDLPDNAYTGAIQSVKNGIYDTSTGGADFFALVIPSFVLCSSKSSVSEFYEDAEESLKKALALNDSSVLANYLMGTLYYRQKRYTEASRFFDISVSMEPESFEILCSACGAALKNGNTDKAFSYSQKLQSLYSNSIEVLKLCAEASYAKKNFSAAESYVARVLQREPDNMEYVLFRAKLLFNSGEYLKASSLLDIYAKTDSDSIDYLLLKTHLLMEWNKNTAAASAFIQNALVLYPDNIEVLLTAAELASESGGRINNLSAEELVASVLKKQPDNYRALKIQVNEDMRNGNWEEAYKSSIRIIKNGKDLSRSADMNSVLAHVEICLNLGFISEASELAEKLYAENSVSDSIRECYIRVLIASGRSGQAALLIEQFLPSASSKMRSSLYYERSRIQSSVDAKLQDLRSSLTSNPRNRNALYSLYEFYYTKADYRKAQYYLKQVIALNSSDERLLALNRELDSYLKR